MEAISRRLFFGTLLLISGPTSSRSPGVTFQLFFGDPPPLTFPGRWAFSTPWESALYDLMGTLELLAFSQGPQNPTPFLLNPVSFPPCFHASGDWSLFALIQLLPILLLVNGLGIQALLAVGKPGKKTPYPLAHSGCFGRPLIFYRLALPYLDLEGHPERFAATGKSLEKFQAFQILSELQRVQGPGLIFPNWRPM